MSNTDFKISSTKILSTVEKWSLSFKHDFKKWSVVIETHNGIVGGDFHSNVATSDLDYFQYPDDVRRRHFEAFKKAIMVQKSKQ